MKKKPRKYSIFTKTGEITTQTFPVRTICEVHRQLALAIEATLVDPAAKRKLLDMVDEAYDMGKRMSDKLKSNHEQAQKPGRWWEADGGFYKEKQ
jgi:hypothetical protein